MDIEELTAAWHKWGNSLAFIVRIRKRVLEKINLPEDTKQFLNQIGLADAIYYGTLTPTLPRLTKLVSDTAWFPCLLAHYRVLGEIGYRMFQCLEEGSGHVVVVMDNPGREREIIFVNSSIRQFAECLLRWGLLWEAIEQQRLHEFSPEWKKHLDEYEQMVRKIDPAALADEMNWFANLLIRVRAGDSL